MLDSWNPRIAQTEGKLYSIVCFVNILKGAQLVKPGSMILLTTITFWLGGGDSLNKGSIGKGNLKEGLVVISDKAFGYDIEKAGVSFETSCTDIIRGWGGNKPASAVKGSSPNANPMASSVCFA